MPSLQPMQIVILGLGLLGALMLAVLAITGPDTAKEANRRLQSVRFRHSDNASDKVEAQMRKALAQRKPTVAPKAGSQSRSAALQMRLYRTGKAWTMQKYMQVSLGLFVVVAMLAWFKFGSIGVALGLGAVLGLGLPHMVVNSQIKGRAAKFVAKFPDAIELLVRGLRSGLPVTETLSVVAQEIPGPVGVEFKLVTERMRIGRTMEDALQETADRIDTAEFSFFCITLAIQRETGGNLAETLANLADVLRKRSQMKLKIKAMSSESKASAYIIGSLPFIVFGLIYSINPQYLGGFFTDQRLIVTGLGGMCWMSMGAFIMAQMINFEI